MQRDHIDQEWVDYPTAERFCSLSHTTLWRYVRSGRIKAARVGRSVRIHLPSLREFMEERCYYAGEEGDHDLQGAPMPQDKVRRGMR